MHKRHVILVLTTLLAQAAFSQGLTLAEAIQEALARHPSLRIAEARTLAAEERTSELRSGLFPQVRFTGRAVLLSDVPEFTVPFLGPTPLFPSITKNYGTRLSLQQTLFTGFRLRSSIDAADANEAAVRYEYQREKSDLIVNVTAAYWNASRASRLEEVLRQSVEQVSAHLNDIRSYEHQGLATAADILKVETRLSDIRVKLIQAQGALKIAQMTLNSLMGRALETPVAPSDDPVAMDEAGLPGSLDEAVRIARERRPEIGAGRERRAMQEAMVTAAAGGWYPSIVLAANVDYARPNPRVIPPEDRWYRTWDVGVQVQWNVWDWFATASQTEQARAQLSQAEAVLVQVTDAVVLETAQSFFSLKEARERIEASRFGARQAQESYRITHEKFRQGLATSSDLLDAEVALLQARTTEANALAEFAVQQQRFRKALGILE
ncbi:MAG: transporter [Bacteroidia bacterium]|nr:MAG: transporter [Bacteroidia bacterium]